jgi:hypothetical protein
MIQIQERLILIASIFLILITLNSVFIQNTNNHVNNYYQELLLSENNMLNSGNLALYNYMMVLRLEMWKSKNELRGNQNLTVLNEKIEEYDDKSTKYANLYNIGAEPLRVKVDNKPTCTFNIDCSNLLTILYFLQFSFISIIFGIYLHVLICINRRINRGSGSE